MWSCVGAYVIAEVKDVEGRTRFKLKQPSKSLLRNFARALYGVMYSTARSHVTKLVDYAGNSHTFPYLYSVGAAFMRTKISEGVIRVGVAVGSGTKSVEFTDYDLDSIIPHGTGAGQLYYNACNPILVEESDYAVVKFPRSFDNASNSNVTVTETGLFCRHHHYNDGYVDYLVARDLLETAITLAPGETLNVRYEIEIRL